MNKIEIINGKLVLPDRVLEGKTLTIEGGKITGIGESEERGERLDANGGYVTAGLIDIHFHGGLLFSPPHNVIPSLEEAVKHLPKNGVTFFLPTFTTAPIPLLHECLKKASEFIEIHPPGACVGGYHLEGPFLNPKASGAHPVEHIVTFDPLNQEHTNLFKAWREIIRVVTFAPEISYKLIPVIEEYGFIGAIGHSMASIGQIRVYASQGMRHLTHLFNAMSGVHHRNLGVAAAGLIVDEVTSDFICDGFHIHPDTVKLILRCRKADDLILITDALGLGNSLDTPYYLPDGRLAASNLSMNHALKNVLGFTNISIPEAVKMATLNPAKLLHLDNQLGSIEAGKQADVVIFDRDWETMVTIVRGKTVWIRR